VKNFILLQRSFELKYLYFATYCFYCSTFLTEVMKERDLKVPELGSKKLKPVDSPEKSGNEFQIKRTKFRSHLVDVFSYAVSQVPI